MISGTYEEGRAEGLAMVVRGLADAVAGFGTANPTETLQAMAGWLHVNGGASFVLRLADAIKAEQEPKQLSVRVANPSSLTAAGKAHVERTVAAGMLEAFLDPGDQTVTVWSGGTAVGSDWAERCATVDGTSVLITLRAGHADTIDRWTMGEWGGGLGPQYVPKGGAISFTLTLG
jgi:hypothetical protein